MATSRKIFLDSSMFTSFIDRTHLNHQKTGAILEFLARQDYQVFTSSITIYQSFNLLERDLGSHISHEFLKAILDSSIKILYISESDLLFAHRVLKSSMRPELSFAEILIARLMEKHGIPSILTYGYWHNVSGTSVSNLINTVLI